MDMQTETYADEANFLDYVKAVLRHKVLISCIVGVAVIGTVIISLFMTPVYEAKAVIAPPGKSTDASSMGLGAMAAQFGLTSPASSNMAELVNLLRSNVLKEKMIKRYNLLPVLVGKGPSGKGSEDRRLWFGIRRLQGVLRVTSNAKESSIQLSASFEDPKIAADMLRYMLAELTEHMTSEARRVAETNKKYLEQEVENTLDPFIRARIYSLIAQQIETSMMAEAKENFAFKVLDPPREPDQKVRPKRAQMVIISFVISLLAGILAAFAAEYWANHKTELKDLAK